MKVTQYNSYTGQYWQSCWKVDRPFSRPLWKAGGELLVIAPYCDFLPTHFYLHLSLFLGSPACRVDAQRLELAQNMPRSTVQAFLMKFGISGREGRVAGNDEEGQGRKGASMVFNPDLISSSNSLLLLSWAININKNFNKNYVHINNSIFDQ